MPGTTPRARTALCAAALTAVLLPAIACSDDEPTPSGGTSTSSGTSGATSSTTSGSPSDGTSSSGSSGGASTATVDIVVSGAVTATLKGNAGTCGGVEGGASFKVRSEELGVSPSFEIAVVILSESDWATPPTVMNVTSPARVNYVWNKSSGTVVAQRDRSRVDLDAELKNIVGAERVTIKGSIVCPP